jgi:orotate phosphoribosyltransferase
MTPEFLDLVAARNGHFRLESGHHASLWLDLESLFVDPAKIRPVVSQLGQMLRSHDLAAVCGPLIGGAFLAQMLAADLGLEFYYTERVLPSHRGELYAVEYHLPESLRDRVRGKRLAVIDDAISAGSAVRGTYADLVAHGALPTVVGSLIVLGSEAARFFAQESVPMVSVAQLPYEIWPPTQCPQCATDIPLQDAPGLAQPKSGRLTSA